MVYWLVNEVKIGIEYFQITINTLGLSSDGKTAPAFAMRIMQEMIVMVSKTLYFCG
jgi:hypothetical protein